MLRLRRHEFNVTWIFLGSIFISVLGFFVNITSPDSLTKITLFFILFFLTVFFTTLFPTNNVRRSGLFAFGLAGILFLRYLNLKEIFYPILLIITLIGIDIYLRKS